jgi:4-amino-4-deoxy-L-arabinose transferase-like glycosyltransferase
MLILLPLLAFGAAFLLFWQREAQGSGNLSGWGTAFLRAAVVWGALVVLFAEGLGLLRAMRPLPLSLAWGAALVVLLGVSARGGGLRKLWSLRRSASIRLSLLEWILLGGLGAEAAVLFAIAWASPPNNTDSLLYHMTRIAHWSQAGAIVHFPTWYEPPLIHPIWAETAILNLRVLWGNDQPANFVQLFSMVGTWIAVAAIARQLGAGSGGRILSVVFAATLPIGILEATSTQNDVVAGFWLATTAFFVLEEQKQGLSTLDLGLAGLGLGLGLLTKGTFYAYGFPFAAWLIVSRLRRAGIRKGLGEVLVLGILVTSLNLGYWARNFRTYRTPLGSPQWMSGHVNRSYAPRAVVASWAENLALNLATPSEEVNGRVLAAVRSLRPSEGEGASTFGLVWAWNNENLAGNPLHLGIIAVSLVMIIAIWIRTRDGGARLAAAHAGSAVASVLLLFAILDFDLYGVRYQIPFFAVMAPVVGLVAERVARPRVVLGASMMLLLTGIPWVLLNGSRPAIGMKPRTMIDSVFDETQPVILLANWTDLRDAYIGAAQTVRESGCRSVGLRLDSHDLEYAYWWLLDAPQSGVRLENIDPPAHLERYVDEDFRPCAVICMVCGGRTRFHGLDLAFNRGEVSVFLGQGYTLGED